jgi:hypothetical protein
MNTDVAIFSKLYIPVVVFFTSMVLANLSTVTEVGALIRGYLDF